MIMKKKKNFTQIVSKHELVHLNSNDGNYYEWIRQPQKV